jgi:hypothetical protein
MKILASIDNSGDNGNGSYRHEEYHVIDVFGSRKVLNVLKVEGRNPQETTVNVYSYTTCPDTIRRKFEEYFYPHGSWDMEKGKCPTCGHWMGNIHQEWSDNLHICVDCKTYFFVRPLDE